MVRGPASNLRNATGEETGTIANPLIVSTAGSGGLPSAVMLVDELGNPINIGNPLPTTGGGSSSATSIASGQETVNPTAALLPTQACQRVTVQSSYSNIANGLILYVGEAGQEVYEMIAGDSLVFNVANVNVISAKCTTAMTAKLNWVAEVA